MANSERKSFVLQTQEDEESQLPSEPVNERSPDHGPPSEAYSSSSLSTVLPPLQTQPQQSRVSRSTIAAIAVSVVVALLLIAGLVLEDEDLSSLKTQEDLRQIFDAEAGSTNASNIDDSVKDKSSNIVGTNPGVPNLHFVTYSNAGCGNDRNCVFCPLIRSAHCAGARIWMLGRGNRTNLGYIGGCRQKLADVHKFLKDRAKHRLHDDELMCFLDGHDTLILRSLHDFELKLREYMGRKNVTVVFNPEIIESSLNSGVYCGEVAHVFRFIDEVMRDTFVHYPERPDQQLIKMILNERRSEFRWVGIDVNHSLLGNNVAKGYIPSFCPLALLKKEELDGFIAAQGVEALPRGTETGNFPYVMHHAGKSKDLYKNCGQVSCSNISAPYYDVDLGEEKICLPLEVHTPVVMNPS